MLDSLVINATILSQERLSGLGVYAANVLRRLMPQLAETELARNLIVVGERRRVEDLFEDSSVADQLKWIELTTNHPIKRIWRLNRVVSKLKRHGSVGFYSPTHHGVVVKGVRQVITIHDLFALRFPANYRMQHYYFKWYMPRVLRRTDVLIADSESTATDCRRFYAQQPPCKVIYLGFRDDLFSDTPQPIRELEGVPFFIFVGPTYHYKNCDRLISAFASFAARHDDVPYHLAFAGGSDGYLQYLREYVASKHPDMVDRVRFLGFVSGDQLAWLYQQATAAAVTSLYEGFGLPALEAQAFGCPVVASNVGALLEVCGTAAMMVDPYDAESIARAMEELVDSPALRQRLIERGRENVARFSWDVCAGDILGQLRLTMS